jgi:hypothetical protein
MSPIKSYYVEVTNPTAQTANLLIYNTKAAAGTEADTIIWTYNGVLPPQSAAAVNACAVGVADECAGTVANNVCGNTIDTYNLASLDNVSIGPGKKILVYVGGFDGAVSGPVVLNIKTKSLM